VKENSWGGLWRVTLDDKGRIAAWDKVPVPVGDSMGMLWAFNSLYVSGQGPDGQASRLSELLCCLPRVQAPDGLGYRNVFRVLIVQFMDARSLDIRSLKKSCIHIAQPDGRLIPFESFNLFYRDGLARRLHVLREEVAASARNRMAPLP